MFAKFAEISDAAWGAVAALVLLGAGLIVLARGQRRLRSPRTLAIGALCVALAFVLSGVRLFRMPQGGSVTPASMLPILAFAYYFGLAPGLLAGVAYGLLQLLQDFWILNAWQTLLDYPIAFGLLALAALCRSMPEGYGFMAGVAVGIAGRFVAAVLSGVVFFSEYAGASNPWIYSMAYNGSYLAAEALICAAVVAIPAVRVTLRRVAAA
ncbi:MAG: energy-coupled thiamine transporter ThiT [Oscillospiraceae bacterium]|jgi:thiamine transporter|nr:energy-coupled thiamine transporter ThiT [Oscillospiraceae bacterium]